MLTKSKKWGLDNTTYIPERSFSAVSRFEDIRNQYEVNEYFHYNEHIDFVKTMFINVIFAIN